MTHDCSFRLSVVLALDLMQHQVTSLRQLFSQVESCSMCLLIIEDHRTCDDMYMKHFEDSKV